MFRLAVLSSFEHHLEFLAVCRKHPATLQLCEDRNIHQCLCPATPPHIWVNWSNTEWMNSSKVRQAAKDLNPGSLRWDSITLLYQSTAFRYVTEMTTNLGFNVTLCTWLSTHQLDFTKRSSSYHFDHLKVWCFHAGLVHVFHWLLIWRHTTICHIQWVDNSSRWQTQRQIVTCSVSVSGSSTCHNSKTFF